MTATPPAGRANHMGISLIVTKSIDREYNETGDAILKQEWMAFVESDAALSLGTAPFTATAPDGSVVSMSVPPGQTEITLPDGSRLPFLRLSSGVLSMRYSPELEIPDNPVRRKIAEIAQHFDALTRTDAGDEFLGW